MSRRANLVNHIERLQANLIKLDEEEAAAALLQKVGFKNGKMMGKEKDPERGIPRKEKGKYIIGPLPPSLASAPKRHIALLFSYSGWLYSGLAYQPPSSVASLPPKSSSSYPQPEVLPTVEALLLEALEKARLIEPMTVTEGFGCGFERCGRTDAGVSSSGQVINLWVRSEVADPMGLSIDREGGRMKPAFVERCTGKGFTAHKPASEVEIPYVSVLNRHLPDGIRIHAWSPVESDFSSRHSCLWRHYKYFFSLDPKSSFLRPKISFGSAYPPSSSSSDKIDPTVNFAAMPFGSLDLSLPLMQEGLEKIIGDHDFRNLCKVDPGKQLTSHIRRVISASIDKVEGEEDVWVLNLRGGAFLYNQVRHIVALLFLIGARLESPNIIDKLLYTSDRTPHTDSTTTLTGSDKIEIDGKPSYEMADDLPLILWECGYNEGTFSWRGDNTPREGDVPIVLPPAPDSPALPELDEEGNVLSPTIQKIRPYAPLDPTETHRQHFLEMTEIWTSYRLKSLILKHHVSSFNSLCPPPTLSSPNPTLSTLFVNQTHTPHGAGRSSKTIKYTPLLRRKRADTPEVANRKWADGRGKGRMEMREKNQEKSDETRKESLRKKEVVRERERELEEAKLRSV